jgi:hypothetical protein
MTSSTFGINFINLFMHGFFMRKAKNCLFFENNFHRAFSYKNCPGCAVHKLRLAVLVAICKLQSAVHKKALKKQHIKKLMKSTPGAVFLVVCNPSMCEL